MGTIIRVYSSAPEYETYLGPILDNPPSKIWEDAEIDMRREVHADPRKRWWLAVDDGELLAMCAAWLNDEGRMECGHNYEFRGRGRQISSYRRVFGARQAWILRHRYNCVTYIFDQPVALHEEAGWRRIKPYDLADVSEHGHHWQHLVYSPR